ncbi:MAG TPA: hypothetical protein VHW02_05040 [Rhizomicrobium sp.]|nr:hypothetical protein [Rhizomicrobium sp.]
MSMAFTGVAQAASQCAKGDEVTAVQAASIQQQLMVAALTCNQITNFNAFQISYGPELRAADATLMKMFKRFYGGSHGEAEYHAFKTRVANDSEMRSIHDNPTYCQAATTVFTTALAPAKPTLAVFVSGVQIMEANPFDSCEIRVAASLPGATAMMIVPKPKPMMSDVATAQSVTAPAN